MGDIFQEIAFVVTFFSMLCEVSLNTFDGVPFVL